MGNSVSSLDLVIQLNNLFISFLQRSFSLTFENLSESIQVRIWQRQFGQHLSYMASHGRQVSVYQIIFKFSLIYSQIIAIVMDNASNNNTLMTSIERQWMGNIIFSSGFSHVLYASYRPLGSYQGFFKFPIIHSLLLTYCLAPWRDRGYVKCWW